MLKALWDKLSNPANWSVSDVVAVAAVVVAALVAIGGVIKWWSGRNKNGESHNQGISEQSQSSQSGGQRIQANNIEGGVHNYGHDTKELVEKLVVKSQEVGSLKSENEFLQQENDDLRRQQQEPDDLKRQLTEAIEALESFQERSTIGESTPAGVTNQQLNNAIARLHEGDTDAAEGILRPLAEAKKAKGEQENKEAAELYRHLGVFYFLHDTDKAMQAYQQSVELDPAEPEGWNRLGLLYKRLGRLEAAENAYQSVLRLGNQVKDKSTIAVAYGNLGNVYQIRGDLDAAEAMYKKSLEINEALGRKDGMASDYGNLGNVYQTRGDLDAAEAMYKKSLEINEALGRKEGMASDYGNLGNVYQIRGDLDAACENWSRAKDLFEEIGIPDKIELIESWMREADCPNSDV